MTPYGAMVALFGDTPVWLTYLIVIVVVAYTTCVFGVVFGKMGRSPIWGLIFLLPPLGTIMIWVFGYGRWPQPGRNTDLESGL